MTSSKRWTAVALVATAMSLTGIAPVSAQTNTAASGTNTSPGKQTVRKENRQLAAKVRHALTTTRHLDSSAITILARGRTVTLDGNAPDDGQISLAGAAAAKVSGVEHVTNNLTVRKAGN